MRSNSESNTIFACTKRGTLAICTCTFYRFQRHFQHFKRFNVFFLSELSPLPQHYIVIRKDNGIYRARCQSPWNCVSPEQRSPSYQTSRWFRSPLSKSPRILCVRITLSMENICQVLKKTGSPADSRVSIHSEGYTPISHAPHSPLWSSCRIKSRLSMTTWEFYHK